MSFPHQGLWRGWIVACLAVIFAITGSIVRSQHVTGAEILAGDDLPAYEHDLRHADLIRGWNDQALVEGREIYAQTCASCHGSLEAAGSMPNALRFAEGAFQRGSDPHAIYRTLTQGWRLMPPQVQLTPREKYSVIHYVREAYLRRYNPGQYFAVTPGYLAGLPRGTTMGPEPRRWEPWREMDYGDFLTGTYEIAPFEGKVGTPNLAYKAIALRLDAGPGGVAEGSTWIAFEHDTLRLAGAWTGRGFIDWRGINFDGRHNVHPATVGTVFASTADVPGWADPSTGRFEDRRVVGLDGRRFGPLPQAWARYAGIERTGAGIVFSYRIGTTAIRERYALEPGPRVAVRRTFDIAVSERDLAVRVADVGVAVRLKAAPVVRASEEDGFTVVRIPASATPVVFDVVYVSAVPVENPDDVPSNEGLPLAHAMTADPVLECAILRGTSDEPWAVDRFVLPERSGNPRRSWMRITGLEFLPHEAAAYLCTWEGEVWRIDGLDADSSTARWRRVASGLFQPLGIAFANGRLLVACRDQIAHLEDRDGDGIFERYHAFNSDHQVTEHFHEFAMGLQVDAAGNLYYAKSARHAKTPLVPHHGTLLKVSADGARTEIVARGFRAANGVCLNPDGSFFVTDQEGHWMPMNRVNRVRPGGFYGNMWGYGAPESTSDDAMSPPLVWVDKAMDRSPAELVRVESSGWGALNGGILSFSYGQGQVFLVTTQQVGEGWQGAYVPLPIPSLPTGIMRGRFRAEDGHLYVTGMSAWATNQVQEPGGLYRLRVQDRPMRVVHAVHAHRTGVDLRFSEPLPAGIVPRPGQFAVATWSLKRSERYGSQRHHEAAGKVAGVQLSADRRTVRIEMPAIAPVDQLEIVHRLGDGKDGIVEGRVLATIHALAETPVLDLP